MDLHIDLIIGMLINIIIMFILIKVFLTKPVVSALHERKKLIEKLENADEEYDAMINEANEKAKNIIGESLQHKKNILQETQTLADKTKNDIIESGRREAEQITKNAEHKAKLLQEEVEQEFATSVKSISEIVVKKLINEDVDIKKSYIETLIHEATNS
ncbi:MAG: hypothetical protein H6766_08060 [Candidatus Peribacteria bacterium]|nr:MAG: hypothetical protein H6766_08060 [Candidatus Peribacteria bacterium]